MRVGRRVAWQRERRERLRLNGLHGVRGALAADVECEPGRRKPGGRRLGRLRATGVLRGRRGAANADTHTRVEYETRQAEQQQRQKQHEAAADARDAQTQLEAVEVQRATRVPETVATGPAIVVPQEEVVLHTHQNFF